MDKLHLTYNISQRQYNWNIYNIFCGHVLASWCFMNGNGNVNETTQPSETMESSSVLAVCICPPLFSTENFVSTIAPRCLLSVAGFGWMDITLGQSGRAWWPNCRWNKWWILCPHMRSSFMGLRRLQHFVGLLPDVPGPTIRKWTVVFIHQ